METTEDTKTTQQTSPFNLGTFGGYSFHDHRPIRRKLTADEVLNWDPATNGAAWFWPRGDHFGIAMVVGHSPGISAYDLQRLVQVLEELGGDSTENWMRIFYVVRDSPNLDLSQLEAGEIPDREAHVFDRSMETSSNELRRQAAVEVMRLRYPDAYRFLMAHHHEGFLFDPERFLNPQDWFTKEVETESRRRMLIVISRHVRY